MYALFRQLIYLCQFWVQIPNSSCCLAGLLLSKCRPIKHTWQIQGFIPQILIFPPRLAGTTAPPRGAAAATAAGAARAAAGARATAGLGASTAAGTTSIGHSYSSSPGTSRRWREVQLPWLNITTVSKTQTFAGKGHCFQQKNCTDLLGGPSSLGLTLLWRPKQWLCSMTLLSWVVLRQKIWMST